MKALEMELEDHDHEDEEQERESFLDSDDQALDESPAHRRTQQLYKGQLESFWNSSSGKLAKSMLLVVVIVLVFSGVAPDGSNGNDDSKQHQQSTNDDSTPAAIEPASSPTSSSGSIPNADTGTDTDITEDPTGPKPLVYSNYATIVPDPYVPEPSAETRQALQAKWSGWKFWDGEEDDRPQGDYCGAYPHRDIPGDDFPDMAWQADAVFVNHYLDAAEQLVSRAKEAIFTEYGHGKPLPPEGIAERLKMFHWDKPEDLSNGYPFDKTHGTGDPNQGGWTTKRSFQGLVRRLLHAMMTNDKFTVVLAGHSAAAGHGNHFHQSYIHQMHKIMAPILARLGVQLVTRNMAIGGLGTLHMAMGFGDMYGDDIDLVLWDSGMTEGKEAFDLFTRQALLSGKKVPVIWAAHGAYFDVLRNLHDLANVDIGEFGSGMAGVLKTTSVQQAKTLPKAVRFMACEEGAEDLCKNAGRFCATCWLRADLDPLQIGFTSIRKTKDIGGQVRWHPGWQSHQLTGRVLAFALLEALQEAIKQWSDGTMGGPPLDDDYWHVSSYYEGIREKVKALDTGLCFDGQWPTRACLLALHGRGEHTPRVNPSQTSLASVARAANDGYKPTIPGKVLYDGPDGHNPCYDVKGDDIDTLAIVSGRRLLVDSSKSEAGSDSMYNHTLRELAGIEPGKGWEIISEKPGVCDGDYYSICGRSADDDCPALAHHDSRGTIVGNEFAGWLVMNINDVKNGLIMLRIISWYKPEDNPRTMDWTSVNNERRRLRIGSNITYETSSTGETTDIYNPDIPFEINFRRLKTLAEFPDDFKFEYSINGVVTTLSKPEFIQRTTEPQRVFELITLLDDPSFQNDRVEVAIRLRDCGHDCMIGITHIYWS